MSVIIPRSPWPIEFLDVVIHSDLRVRDTHPSYVAAKTGDAESANRLVRDLLSVERTEWLARFLAGKRVILVGVTADEVGGFNAIPDALAQILAECIDAEMASGTIIQANKVGHTKADGWHRLVTPAVFIGNVIAGAEYVPVDDHVGLGGTFANLRGMIEGKGGRVLAMTALNETRGARNIGLHPETLNVQRSKHGRELESFWLAEFGHGIDCLTNIEAGYLYRVESVAAIKTRMAQAAELARRGGMSAVGLSAPPIDNPPE